MTKQFGTAGLGARKMAKDRYIKVAGYAGILLAIPIFLFLKPRIFPSSGGLAGLIGLAATAGVALFLMKSIDKKATHVIKRAKDADRGALAEEKVALQLDQLPEGYFGFHDVDFKGFNIDHVVLGPAGIFVVETKSHRGTVDANGHTLLLNGKPSTEEFLEPGMEPDQKHAGIPLENDVQRMEDQTHPLLYECLCKSQKTGQGSRGSQP